MIKRQNAKSYSELMKLETFEERFAYLQTTAKIGVETFGSKRYLNQMLYKDEDWKRVRNEVIIRDNGCDLAMPDRLIGCRITVHHINPISVEDVLNRDPCVYDMNNLVTVSDNTHKAIHYSNSDILLKNPIERSPNDTAPWRH